MEDFILSFSYSLLDKREGVYIVERGETLNDIEKKFNTTKQLIIAKNFLKEDVNKDDYLYIKCYNNVYIVTPSHTLDTLAKKFGISKEKILKDNKIKYIYPYQKIIIKYD